jgi:hypothetical protein
MLKRPVPIRKLKKAFKKKSTSQILARATLKKTAGTLKKKKKKKMQKTKKRKTMRTISPIRIASSSRVVGKNASRALN